MESQVDGMAMQQQNTSKFALIQFTEENETSISVVPTSWLQAKNLCRWPKVQKNIRTLIIKQTEPKEDWELYECSLFNTFETYEMALKAEKEAAASSESESEVRMGKRKIKLKKYPDFQKMDNIVEPPKLVFESSSTNLDVEYLEGASAANSVIELEHNLMNTPVLLAAEPSGFSNIQELKDEINNLSVIMNNFFDEFKNHQIETKEILKVILKKINSNSYDCGNNSISVTKENKIISFIPVEATEQLLALEQTLKNDEEAFQQLTNKIVLTGGKNEKDFVKRSLTKIFKNEVAVMCSWTGQKGNFKISDTHVITCLKKAFWTQFPHCSEKQFEHLIMDWFRYANVRLQNEKKTGN